MSTTTPEKKKAKRPEVSCWECGKRTTAQSGLCKVCQRHTFTPSGCDVSDYTLGLQGGRWVPDGLVQRWVPWQEAG